MQISKKVEFFSNISIRESRQIKIQKYVSFPLIVSLTSCSKSSVGGSVIEDSVTSTVSGPITSVSSSSIPVSVDCSFSITVSTSGISGFGDSVISINSGAAVISSESVTSSTSNSLSSSVVASSVKVSVTSSVTSSVTLSVGASVIASVTTSVTTVSVTLLSIIEVTNSSSSKSSPELLSSSSLVIETMSSSPEPS